MVINTKFVQFVNKIPIYLFIFFIDLLTLFLYFYILHAFIVNI